MLGQNLAPEYHVVSGLRRMSSDQQASLTRAGVQLTPEVIAKNRRFAFHDAPLEVPERAARRCRRCRGAPSEIRRADASFNATAAA